jgi:hypothetical protein
MGNHSHLLSSPEHDEKRLLILKEFTLCKCAICEINDKFPDLSGQAVDDIFYSIVDYD